MKKIGMMMIVAVFVAGCVPMTPKECIKKRAVDSCTYNRSGKVSDQDIYGVQASGIKQALDAALKPTHGWEGKRCNAHLDFNIDGKLQHFIVKGGDKDYCAALVEAAQHAEFPAFTDQHVYDVMGSARWDMQGKP